MYVSSCGKQEHPGTLRTNVHSVQSVANERTTAEVGRSAVEGELTDAADEAPANPGTPAHHTDVSVSTDIQFRARSDLAQPALPPTT